MVSLEGLKINKDQPPILQYYESVNNRSQRRKLANRTTAIYIIVFLLPICALFLFRYLNISHAGDPTFFLHSQYANWHVIGDIPIGEMLNSEDKTNVGVQYQLVFQAYVLFLNPLLILVFFYYKGKIYELFTLLAPFILMSALIVDMRYYFTIEYYLIFLILALLGLSVYVGKKFNKKVTWFLVFTVGLLNVFMGIYYFKKTDDREEQQFYSSIKNYKNWLGSKIDNEEFEIEAYISSIADKNNKVLIDDGAAFKIIAHMKSLEGVVVPMNKSFLTVIENPIVGARYMCIAKENNKLKTFSILNDFNLRKMEARGQFIAQIMFETKHWAVYRLF